MRLFAFTAAALALSGCHKSDEPIDPETQKPEMCKILAGQVVDGQKVLEVNNVKVEDDSLRAEPNEIVTCTGDAITAAGDRQVEFGLIRTPQGKGLVATRFP